MNVKYNLNQVCLKQQTKNKWQQHKIEATSANRSFAIQYANT